MIAPNSIEIRQMVGITKERRMSNEFCKYKRFLETMFVKNLSINVIATFEDEHKEPQDIFDLSFITKDRLKNTKSLIDYIKDN